MTVFMSFSRNASVKRFLKCEGAPSGVRVIRVRVGVGVEGQ